MPRKKKEAPTQPQEAKPDPPIEPKVDYSELWFAERIGSKVEAVLGKDITKDPVLFHSLIGPFQTLEECLVAVEKKQAEIDKETKKHKAIATAEPEPLPFKKKENVAKDVEK